MTANSSHYDQFPKHFPFPFLKSLCLVLEGFGAASEAFCAPRGWMGHSLSYFKLIQSTGKALGVTLFPKTLLLWSRRTHGNEGSKHCLLLAAKRLLGSSKS